MIILASNSPRRREILADLGVEFRVLSADTDESCDITDPVLFAEELARRKGEAAYRLLVDTEGEELAREAVIISADTVVAAEGEILGKPRDVSDARRMLSLLSGRTHNVITGIGITAQGVTHLSHSNTKVVVDSIPEDEIDRYIASGDPMDKAGAYGIQSGGGKFVLKYDGDFDTVVGLSVSLTERLIREAQNDKN